MATAPVHLDERRRRAFTARTTAAGSPAVGCRYVSTSFIAAHRGRPAVPLTVAAAPVRALPAGTR